MDQFDHRHFSFTRNSGLSRNYFDPPPSRFRRYFVAGILYAIIAILIYLGFWFTSASVDDELIRPDSSPVSPQRADQRNGE